MDSSTDPRASLIATPNEIQQGEEVTFDGRDSDPIEGVITEYKWDFGDGTKVTTIAGFTSHQFLKAGQFNVQLTVINDQGGTDSTTAMVRVNGAPQINYQFRSCSKRRYHSIGCFENYRSGRRPNEICMGFEFPRG